MEELRDVALYYYRDTTRHKIYKQSMNILDIESGAAPPKIDTAKWESRQQLLDHCLDESPKWRVLEHVASRHHDLKDPQPPLPAGARLRALREIPPVLEL
eukprot:1404452-Karenia_brevis.AAC.1